jgi:hypothetical protein
LRRLGFAQNLMVVAHRPSIAALCSSKPNEVLNEAAIWLAAKSHDLDASTRYM